MGEQVKHHVSAVELMDFRDQQESKADANGKGTLENISDIQVELIAKLGRTKTTIGEIRKLKVGDILEVEKKSGHKIDIYLENARAGIGEAVLLEENFGVIISEIRTEKKKK